jgi:hypothetical protein
VLKNKSSAPFILSDAFYYSWFAGENEYGTNVQIKLKDVEPGITFDSLIFRNLKVPVDVFHNKEEIMLKSVLPGDLSRLRIKKERVEKSNRLLFLQKGERQVYLLDNIRREKMKYY